jgi:hypothetical protein
MELRDPEISLKIGRKKNARGLLRPHVTYSWHTSCQDIPYLNPMQSFAVVNCKTRSPGLIPPSVIS